MTRNWVASAMLTPLGVALLLVSPLAAQYVPTVVRPTPPVAPVSFGQCAALQAEYDGLIKDASDRHDTCLKAPGSHVSSGGSCTRRECQGLHDFRDELQKERGERMDWCRSAVEAHRQREREREAELARQRREQQQRDEAAWEQRRQLMQTVNNLNRLANEALERRTAERQAEETRLQNKADTRQDAYSDASARAQEQARRQIGDTYGNLRNAVASGQSNPSGNISGYNLGALSQPSASSSSSSGFRPLGNAVMDRHAMVRDLIHEGPAPLGPNGTFLGATLGSSRGDFGRVSPEQADDLRTLVDAGLRWGAPEIAPNIAASMQHARRLISPLEDVYVMTLGEGMDDLEAAGRVLGRGAPSQQARENIENSATLGADALLRLTESMASFESGRDPVWNRDNLLTRLESGDGLAWAQLAPGPLRSVAQKAEHWRGEIQSAGQTLQALLRTTEAVISTADSGIRSAARRFTAPISALFSSRPREYIYEVPERD
jgi:hypothetical protein